MSTPVIKAVPAAPASSRMYPLFWRMVLALTILKFIEANFQTLKAVVDNGRHLAADFIVFWTAARSDAVYDFQALTNAQYWYMKTETLRPFPYPPSFLPWIEPFGALELATAYLLWTGATLLLFGLAWRRLLGSVPVAAALLAPVVVMGAVPGQMVFLLGALLVGGMAAMERQPIVAGILLGVAATLKPQALLLVPLALLAARQWKCLAAASATGATIGVLCLVVQGVQIWWDWFEALPRFMDVLRASGMMEFGITPASSLARAGLDGTWTTLFLVAAAAIGASAVWLAFRRPGTPAVRIVALNAGTLLVLPYAMPYELALSAPAAMALLMDRNRHPAVWLAAFLMVTGSGQLLGPLTVCAIWLLAPQLFDRRDPVAGSGTAFRPLAQPALSVRQA